MEPILGPEAAFFNDDPEFKPTLKSAQQYFTSPLVPLALDANVNPLSITAVIASFQVTQGGGPSQDMSAVLNGGPDVMDWSPANLTITPLGSYVLLTDELYTSMNSGDQSKIQGAQVAASAGMTSLLESVARGYGGLAAFVPVTTTGLDYDLAVCSLPEADWILWLASKPVPPPSGSNAPTNAMIYTLGSYNKTTGICTSTSLQIVGATAGWLCVWVGVALGLAGAGAFGASFGSTSRGIDFITVMAGPGRIDLQLEAARSANSLGGTFISGGGLAAAKILYGLRSRTKPTPGSGVTIWNLDPNNDIKVAAPYLHNASVSGATNVAPMGQDVTIPKAIPAGGVWIPEGFNPTTALTMACCTEEFLFFFREPWITTLGVAMCAVRGADPTGVGLKFVLSLPANIEMGTQASIAPDGPALQSFYNDSSSLNNVQQQKISVPAGCIASAVSSMDPEKQMTSQITFLLSSTP